MAPMSFIKQLAKSMTRSSMTLREIGNRCKPLNLRAFDEFGGWEML